MRRPAVFDSRARARSLARPLSLAGAALVTLAALASAPTACGGPARTASAPSPVPPPGPETTEADAGAAVTVSAAEAGPGSSAQSSSITPDAGDAGEGTAALESADGAPPASSAQAGGPGATASDTSASSGASACNDQEPQDFLVRSNFLKGGQEAMKRAIQYRTDTYGYFKGFGRAPADAAAPSTFVVTTTFMNLPVRMHRKVVPALKCVEAEIRRACVDHPYTPQALAGIRFRNTYRGGEVTNHIYGIAIDVDPARNTCCGCVPPWNDAPRCKGPAKSEYDRMEMPECWVHAFERFGFYWLGHDRLKDTMHFEFLGDPEKIVKHAAM